VVEELDSSGQKTAGYVYGPGGELLATQTSESGTNVVTWKHLTSFGTGEYSINTQNSTVGRVEFDPLHANVSTTAPSNPPLLEGQGDVSPSHSGSNLSARFGDIFNTTAGCMIDGIPSTCDMAMSLRNRGAGDRVTKALVYNHGTRGIDWYGDVHEEGVAGFTFLEFRSATGGTMGGGYAPDTYSEVLGGTQNSSVTIYGGAALASTAVGAEPNFIQPQNPPARNPTDFRRDVFNKFEADINRCIGEIFKEILKKNPTKIPTQTLALAPDVDVSLNGRELANRSDFKGKVRSVISIPDPKKGTNGTVFLQSGAWNLADYPQDVLEGAYIHEYGNLLSYKVSKDYYKFGDKAGVGEKKDRDTGANFQRCVHPSSVKF
jgi:hypothetical protein